MHKSVLFKVLSHREFTGFIYRNHKLVSDIAMLPGKCSHSPSLPFWPQADEALYEQECLTTPCFSHHFGEPDGRRASYDDFRRLNVKWQQKLGKLFADCLNSKEYVQTRNALLILNRIVQV